jgi:hypothetical protein
VKDALIDSSYEDQGVGVFTIIPEQLAPLKHHMHGNFQPKNDEVELGLQMARAIHIHHTINVVMDDDMNVQDISTHVGENHLQMHSGSIGLPPCNTLSHVSY